jgi:hypothetical protein
MKNSSLYVITDCYPERGSVDFRTIAGAAVGCWLREDLFRDHGNIDLILEEKFRVIGWKVVRILQQEHVTSETYLDKRDGFQFFEQAQTDGFVANLQRVERELIGDAIPFNEMTDLLDKALDAVVSRGAVSMFSEADQQWANGVTPRGDTFLPFWLNDEDTSRWLQHWPGYELQDLSVDELRGSDFLEQVNLEDMWIGLGVTPQVLVTCHPIWIRDRMLESAGSA